MWVHSEFSVSPDGSRADSERETDVISGDRRCDTALHIKVINNRYFVFTEIHAGMCLLPLSTLAAALTLCHVRTLLGTRRVFQIRSMIKLFHVLNRRYDWPFDLWRFNCDTWESPACSSLNTGRWKLDLIPDGLGLLTTKLFKWESEGIQSLISTHNEKELPRRRLRRQVRYPLILSLKVKRLKWEEGEEAVVFKVLFL